jgi:hypothetical protein
LTKKATKTNYGKFAFFGKNVHTCRFLHRVDPSDPRNPGTSRETNSDKRLYAAIGDGERQRTIKTPGTISRTQLHSETKQEAIATLSLSKQKRKNKKLIE